MAATTTPMTVRTDSTPCRPYALLRSDGRGPRT